MAVDEENVTQTDNIIVANVNKDTVNTVNIVNTNLSLANNNINVNSNMNNSINNIVNENNPSANNVGTNPSGQKRRIAPTMLN